MKQIFFKTVRADGGSVWAIDTYRQVYEPNNRYVFDSRTPAHVFGLSSNGAALLHPSRGAKFTSQEGIPHDAVYRLRPEAVGTKVVICYGEVYVKRVPFCWVGRDWDFSKAEMYWQFVSVDFLVLDWILPKTDAEPPTSHQCVPKGRVLVDIDDVKLNKLRKGV